MELAKKARLSQAFVSSLETGSRASLALPYAVQLAKALGVTLDELTR